MKKKHHCKRESENIQYNEKNIVNRGEAEVDNVFFEG